MSRKRKGSLESIAEVVQRVQPARAPQDRRISTLFNAWAHIVPERAAANARPVRIRRKELIVHTSTSAWAAALQIDTDALLTRLHKAVPDADIERLVFRMGPLPPMPARVKRQRPPPPLIALEALPESIARELARIDDDGVREAIARAASTLLSRRPN